MHILLTRPQPDASPMATQLHDKGHTTIIEPLISIAVDPPKALDLAPHQALIFTSANGARAAARHTENRQIPVIAVGPVTAAQAAHEGFSNITYSTGEGVAGLAAHIRKTVTPSAGTLLHITGTHTAGDLAAALAPHGFAVSTLKLYSAVAATQFSAALAAQLHTARIGAALFYSPRTAATFANLAIQENFQAACGNIAAIALSANVARSLGPLTFRKVLQAQTATTNALLELIDTL